MRKLILLSLAVFITLSFAVYKSFKVGFDFSELPKNEQLKLEKMYGLKNIKTQNKGSAVIEDDKAQKLLKGVVDSCLMKTSMRDIMGAAPFLGGADKTYPRLRYWLYVTSQMPKFVKSKTYNKAYAAPNMGEKHRMLAYLVYHVNRSPQNLKKTFQQYKSVIYALVSKEKYESQKLGLYVKTLIKSYRHLTSLPDYKSKLKQVTDQIKAADKDKWAGSQGHYKILKPYLNQGIVKTFQRAIPLPEAMQNMEAVWMHSFWVRRYQEKNAKVVFQILKEIDKHYQ